MGVSKQLPITFKLTYMLIEFCHTLLKNNLKVLVVLL